MRFFRLRCRGFVVIFSVYTGMGKHKLGRVPVFMQVAHRRVLLPYEIIRGGLSSHIRGHDAPLVVLAAIRPDGGLQIGFLNHLRRTLRPIAIN